MKPRVKDSQQRIKRGMALKLKNGIKKIYLPRKQVSGGAVVS